MLNIKSLLKKILETGIFKTGVTMTGEIKTSFQNFIGFGSYSSNQTSVTNFMNEIRYSSGAMGTVTFSSANSSYGATLPAGTYRFIIATHRSGGLNGADQGDNCKYNNTILINTTTNRMYILHSNNNTGTGISEIREINTAHYTPTGIAPSTVTNSYYSLNTSNSYTYQIEGSHIHIVTLYVNCTTVSDSSQLIATVQCNLINRFDFVLTNTAGTVIEGYINTSGNIYVMGGYKGHGFKGTIAFISSN